MPPARCFKRFSRAYPKVPHVEERLGARFSQKNGSPKIEFESDVNDLFPVADRLWVVTSTDDKAKGRLIDVFDKDGRFSRQLLSRGRPIPDGRP